MRRRKFEPCVPWTLSRTPPLGDTYAAGDAVDHVTDRSPVAPCTGPSIVTNRPTPVHGLRVEYTSTLLQDPRGSLPSGVLVKELIRGSPADAKLKPQSEGAKMIVTRVNGKPVTMPQEFYQAAGKGPVELEVVDLVREPETTARTVRLP